MNGSLNPVIEKIVTGLQLAYEATSGAKPSTTEAISAKWRRVAEAVLHDERIRDITDERYLAIILHEAFIGNGHRLVLEDKNDQDFFLVGWIGSARYVIAQRPYLSFLPS